VAVKQNASLKPEWKPELNPRLKPELKPELNPLGVVRTVTLSSIVAHHQHATVIPPRRRARLDERSLKCAAWPFRSPDGPRVL
jgi:hypothetical protein